MDAIRHLTASAVVVDLNEQKVLLVHHRATGAWMFPGGHVDPGEAPAEAATREVREETGVPIGIVHPHRAVTLPGMQVLAAPWMICEIPAPAKPERPGKPAEDAHSHIDCLYLAIASAASPLCAAEDEVQHVGWFHWDLLPAEVRAEVPTVLAMARRELLGMRGGHRTSMVSVVGDGSTSIQVGGHLYGYGH